MGQHRFSGWPGAFCLLCHAGDALEQALADEWYDPGNGSWDTKEHEEIVIKAQNNCPHTKEGQDPYTVNWENGKLVTKERIKMDFSEKGCKSGPI